VLKQTEGIPGCTNPANSTFLSIPIDLQIEV
jgi:hypothetical protein